MSLGRICTGGARCTTVGWTLWWRSRGQGWVLCWRWRPGSPRTHASDAQTCTCRPSSGRASPVACPPSNNKQCVILIVNCPYIHKEIYKSCFLCCFLMCLRKINQYQISFTFVHFMILPETSYPLRPLAPGGCCGYAGCSHDSPGCRHTPRPVPETESRHTATRPPLNSSCLVPAIKQTCEVLTNTSGTVGPTDGPGRYKWLTGGQSGSLWVTDGRAVRVVMSDWRAGQCDPRVCLQYFVLSYNISPVYIIFFLVHTALWHTWLPALSGAPPGVTSDPRQTPVSPGDSLCRAPVSNLVPIKFAKRVSKSYFWRRC